MSYEQRVLAAKVVATCVFYYIISAATGIIQKRILAGFAYPLTIATVEVVLAYLCSIPLMALTITRQQKTVELPTCSLHGQSNWYWYTLTALAACKFAANLSDYVGVWQISVSYSHTVKATMPIFTVVLSRLVLNERHKQSVHMSLVPIVLGVAVATASEAEFSTLGLFASLISTLLYAVRNVYSKKYLSQNLHEFELLHLLAKLGLVVSVPMWLLIDFRRLVGIEMEVRDANEWMWISLWTVVDGVLLFAQNCLSYMLMAMLSQLSYSIANCCKRVAVIIASIVVLQNSVNALNLLGISVATAGVLYYSVVKFYHS